MNIFTNNVTKTISKLLLASTLLISVSAQAVEKEDIKAVTNSMIEQNTQQVHQQLAQELNSDIQFSVVMTLPLQMTTDVNTGILLAKTEVKAKNKKNKSHGE